MLNFNHVFPISVEKVPWKDFSKQYHEIAKSILAEYSKMNEKKVGPPNGNSSG